jgi:hypothetical protein
MPDAADASALQELLQNELVNIPLDQWGFFFPAHVAVWRFIHKKRPLALGDVNAGYDTEPWYAGRGATWFTDELLNRPDFIDVVDRIMRAAVDQAVATPAKERGFLLSEEAPAIDFASASELAQIVLAATDDALLKNKVT